MPPFPRPLLGVILLASTLLPSSVQGVPVEGPAPPQPWNWNATAPGNSSHFVRPPPRPWNPVPFSWNPVPGPVPPRPYHEHGYSEFHQVGKTNNNKGDDERESQPPAAAAPSVQRAPDDEDLNESETKEDDGDREEVKVTATDDMNESDAQESDDEGNDEWNPFVETRHGEASKPDADDMDDLDDDNDDDNDDDKEQQERGDDDDHENERWDPKQRGHGFRMPWARN